MFSFHVIQGPVMGGPRKVLEDGGEEMSRPCGVHVGVFDLKQCRDCGD